MNAQQQRLELALEECEHHQRLHEFSAKHFSRISRSLGVGVTALALCASLLMFLTGFQLEPVRWMQLLAACLSLAAAGVTAAPFLLHETDRVQRHCAASAHYAEMRHELGRLATSAHIDNAAIVEEACARLTSLNVRSPNVPHSVIRSAKRQRIARSPKSGDYPTDDWGDRAA